MVSKNTKKSLNSGYLAAKCLKEYLSYSNKCCCTLQVIYDTVNRKESMTCIYFAHFQSTGATIKTVATLSTNV